LATFVAASVLGAGAARGDFKFGTPTILPPLVPDLDVGSYLIECFSYDGLEMYISSDCPGGEGGADVWVLRRSSVDEAWGSPENLGPLVNSPQHDQTVSISSDGLTLLFSSLKPGGYGGQDIYATTRPTRDAPWEEATNMGLGINSSTHDACPWMSADGLELYFGSYRTGGSGRWDIYVARRTTVEVPWGEPVNLGPVVNSAASEVASCLSPDGRILLFSDNFGATLFRSGGYGGTDMWMTTRKTLTEPWETPVNLGPTVNSSADDAISRFSLDGSRLYFLTSDEAGNWINWEAPILPIVDFNGDGAVDVTDIDILIDRWGEDEPLCDIGPMPWGDGVVDVEDLVVLVEHLVVSKINVQDANDVDVF
jgi:Tol biopolymer transport system component